MQKKKQFRKHIDKLLETYEKEQKIKLKILQAFWCNKPQNK